MDGASESIFDEDAVQRMLLAKALPPSSPVAARALGESPSFVREGRGGTSLCAHQHTCWGNCRFGFYKGFWVGAGVKGAINAVTAALFRGMWRRPGALVRVAVGEDACRFGLFWGLFTAGFKGGQCALRRVRGREDWLNSFVAAGLASLAVVVDDPGRQVTWALWMLTRAGDLAWRHFGALGYLPVSDHGDAIAFTLASAVVMVAWHLFPFALGSGYRRWISARGGLDDRIITGMREVVLEGRAPDLRDWCAEHGLPSWNAFAGPPGSARPERVPCSVFHPLEPRSCTLHTAKRWLLGFRDGLPVYVTVHFLPLLLFRMRRLLKEPAPVLRHAFASVFYSTAFITSFQSIFWFVFCNVRNLRGRDTALSTVLAGVGSGLSIFFERKGRRAELALFSIPRAIACSWAVLERYGYVRSVPHAHVGIFALGMATIMTFHQHRPEVIKESYRRLLQRYFGVN